MKRFLISFAMLLLLIVIPVVAAKDPVNKLTIDSIPGGGRISE